MKMVDYTSLLFIITYMKTINEDKSPSLYMQAMGIATRCREALERLDVDDCLRPNIEALMELAEVEAAVQAGFMPY